MSFKKTVTPNDEKRLLSLHVSLLLAGFSVPRNKELSPAIAMRRDNIEATIAKWLSP